MRSGYSVSFLPWLVPPSAIPRRCEKAMPSDAPLLRFMVFSAVIGFVVFCASYAMLVWRKRRPTNPEGSRLRRWSVTCLVLGALGLASTFAIREAVRADGMLRGDGLHALRSPADLRILDLVEEGAAVKRDD